MKQNLFWGRRKFLSIYISYSGGPLRHYHVTLVRLGLHGFWLLHIRYYTLYSSLPLDICLSAQP